MGQAAAYGSIPSGSLSEDQKNAVYAMLKDAISKGTEIDTWIHAAGEDGQRAAMGSSFDTFRGYINNAGDLAETVYPYYQRLGSSNAEDWYVLDEDTNKIVEFVNTINQAYQLYSSMVKGVAHGPVPVSTSSPRPGAVPTGAPSTAKPAVAPTKGIMPEAKILGVPQSTFIVTGGIVAIGGILAYGLLK